jgi:ribosomal 30S subunit maturation factor RimM
MNTVLQIENDEQQEFLLPFAQELIVTIDEAERKIIMNLPDGIFDLE